MLSKRISALLLLSAICLSSVYIVMRGASSSAVQQRKG